MTMTSEAATRVSNSASVHLEAISKSIGGTRILAGVDLDVNAGEFVTLLGPSGSGKTSTLMAIAGFVTPDSGRITVRGRDVTVLPPGRERDMGIVFQNYALFPHMTVAENVAYPLKVRRLPRREIETRVADVLKLVQLDALADRKPARLSGGQQQRVALARALVFEPSVLLMDEPMGALDVRLKEELQLELRRLQKEIGATVIYVTHDQNEAMLMSDRVALMRDGQIEQYGPGQELYRHPRSLFAARFLGDSNLLKGMVRDGWLDVGGLRIALPTGTLAATGERQAALLRPETLTVREGATGALMSEDGACLYGTVRDAAFVGQAMRYEIDVPGLPEPLLVHQVACAAHAQLAIGMPAQITWDRDDIHLIALGDQDE
ncbi:ABC transporter ATP-binding protein [Poseidonocella sp. HB161398]|uniref:ABC transporter ATP-binding protein n=1 Tax=Poseidonocella sp. HB161398 TaxID=2320855 RepID=UPI0014868AA1|nr:ABC transporter ATP-binding protein [Poseidonocella sp. HB161398]